MNQNQSDIKQAFEQPGWYLNRTAYNIQIRIETIQEFIGDLKPQNILDIGCGNGSLSLHLLNGTNRLTLLDQSRGMLDIALSKVPNGANSRVRVVNDSFMSARLPEEKFDLILCVGVLAYVEDRRAFLRKIAGALQPGGILIMECTDGDHFVTHLVRGYLTLKRNLLGDRFVTFARPSTELISMLAELEFELRGSFRYCLPLPGVERLLSQKASYKGVRFLYGSATKNYRAAFGNECLYCFQQKGSV